MVELVTFDSHTNAIWLGLSFLFHHIYCPYLYGSRLQFTQRAPSQTDGLRLNYFQVSVCGDVGSVRSDTSDSDSESEGGSQVLHLKLTDSTLGEEGHPGDEEQTEGEGGHHGAEREKSDSDEYREVEIIFRILLYCKR